MTTICWDGETLATDSLLNSDSGVSQVETKKLFKVNRYFDFINVKFEDKGFYLAGAGNYTEILTILDTLNFSSIEESEFFILDINLTKCYYIDSYGIMEIKESMAIGSGSQYAMGAMLAGSNAAEAVKIASQLDTETGGNVQYIKVTYS